MADDVLRSSSWDSDSQRNESRRRGVRAARSYTATPRHALEGPIYLVWLGLSDRRIRVERGRRGREDRGRGERRC